MLTPVSRQFFKSELVNILSEAIGLVVVPMVST